MTRTSAAVAVEVGRAALGILHLSRSGTTRGTTAFHRILGFRQLAQAALLLRSGSADAHTLGAAVDATHAVTMVPLLMANPRWRAIGASQLWIATGLAVAEIALVGAGRKR
ncbi:MULTISPECIES: hypothetical protein [unclassified Curtobacterium]|uniref:hypothetical protein n=1 Tax=unclassified Curtobacterium TaxID=257496 RepID=UPI0037F93298